MPDLPVDSEATNARAAEATQESPARPNSGGDVAVVLFHGIGSQLRYESVAELADRLDQVLRQDVFGAPYSGARLVQVRAKMQPPSPAAGPVDSPDVTYMHGLLLGPADEKLASIRFYEAYWAPEAVGGTSARKVVLWLGKQIRKPWKLIRAPWRSYARLRRADLLSLRDRLEIHATAGDRVSLRAKVATLVRLQRVFSTRGRRQQFPHGTFNEFLRFIGSEASPADATALAGLARAWRAFHLRSEWSRLLAIALLFLGAVTLVSHVVLLVVWMLAAAGAQLPWAAELIGDDPKSRLMAVAAVTTAVFSLVGASAFIRDYVGDVQQYAAYSEVDALNVRRRAILDRATTLLRNVLDDPAIKRVVIVAHSLGSAVALDALLELWRHNRARHPADALTQPIPLDRVHHFITIGSPIDKINYFFAVEQSRFAAYESFIEDLRGDIGMPPFSKSGRQPHLHWINFWDRGDIISGPIETVASPVLREQEVDNVRLVRFRMPDPGASHGSYLASRVVLKTLLDIVVSDAYCLAHVPDGKKRRLSFDEVRLGPGRASALQSGLFGLLVILPFLFTWSLVERLLALGWVGSATAALSGAVLAAGMLLHRDRGIA